VYANIMGLPMRITNDAAELTYALNAFREYDLVLMDTAGGSQFNQEQIRELKSLLDIARPDEVMLVLPANMQVEELRSVVESFRCMNPTSLLFSKLDETRRYGALFSVAVEANLALSYFSVGQNVPDDIELATPSKTAKLLLEDSDSRVGSSAKSS
jgi:flagellar biosynthesis protein FlhF